jgi:hypothetical protein
VPNITIEASLASDLALAVDGTVGMELWSWAGKKLFSDNQTLGVPPFGTTGSADTLRWNLPSIMPANVSVNECVALVEFSSNGGSITSSSQIFLSSFAAAKGLKKPNFAALILQPPVSGSASVSSVSFQLTSDAMAALVAVEVNHTKLPGRFSDSAFMLRPGVPTELTFTAWGSFVVQDFVDELKIRSAAAGAPQNPVWK